MATGVEIKEFVKREVRNPLVVVGFPTVGFVGAIAAQYLADSLSLGLIGGMYSPNLPAVALVANGDVLPAYRVYAGDEVCGPDGECDQLIVMTSELAPPNPVLWQVAEGILAWAGANRARNIVALEGVASESEVPGPQVWGVATADAGRDALKKHDIPTYERGVIMGLSAAVLSLALDRKASVTCLLTEAHPQIPDARAAAALISAVARLTPRLTIDPAPLLKEAERIEGAMRRAAVKFEDVKRRQPAQPEIESSMFA